MFGGRPALVWANTSPGDSLTLPFLVREAGRYAIRLTGLPGEGAGRFAATIDNTLAHPGMTFRPSGFHQGYNTPDVSLGCHELAVGEHLLILRPASEDAVSLGVETLRLLKLPAEAVRSPKTHNEAHFYRLGIGRAVYAYRLAYDALPESLHVLYESGLLDSRYLEDENGYVLESQREGEGVEECFVVSSTAPTGWKHRWQGLDARR
jgi:hypothetical protein